VEEQNKQVELKEEHQQEKDHPRTPDYPLQMSSRIQTTTKPQAKVHLQIIEFQLPKARKFPPKKSHLKSLLFMFKAQLPQLPSLPLLRSLQ
jgi:hypothetical protein